MPLECGKPGKLPCHRCHDSCQPFANHLGIISNISNHLQISWYIWYWYPKQMVCFGIYHAIGKENGHRKEQTFRWSASQCGDCMDPRAGATSQSLTTSPWQCVGQGTPLKLTLLSQCSGESLQNHCIHPDIQTSGWMSSGFNQPPFNHRWPMMAPPNAGFFGYTWL